MSILDPSLRNALRTLKLTGMLETLDARLAQTRDGTLGHLDFLQVLCEDEIARRESAALTRRIRRAAPFRRAGSGRGNRRAGDCGRQSARSACIRRRKR